MLLEVIEDFRRRREEGQRSSSPPIQRGRAGASSMIRNLVEIHPGGLSTWLTRGRGLPSHSPPQPGGRARGRALPPPSPQDPFQPTVRVLRLKNVHMGPLRCPGMSPQCLQPQGQFSSPPRYILQDSNDPPRYEDLFPPCYGTACCLLVHSLPLVPVYETPQSFILDPTPPFSFSDSHTSSESSDSDGFLPYPPESGYEADSE